jgi:hypothetical protein
MQYILSADKRNLRARSMMRGLGDILCAAKSADDGMDEVDAKEKERARRSCSRAATRGFPRRLVCARPG